MSRYNKGLRRVLSVWPLDLWLWRGERRRAAVDAGPVRLSLHYLNQNARILLTLKL